ncbi:MAG: [protein-PII] uridylyltransferase [Pseudomonadales bacterium]
MPPVSAARALLAAAAEALERRFDAGADILDLLRDRACAVDEALALVWRSLPWPDDADERLSLVAVGGYGRVELHPHSDVDILILTRDEPDTTLTPSIEKFLTMTWDLNLQVGHSVRPITECLRLAREDLTIATTLIESRTLVGRDALRRELTELLDEKEVWPSKEFFKAKLSEQDARHRRFENVEYNLEPNVKQSPGGLRDIQMVRWITRRHFGTDDFAHLVALGFLTAEEHEILSDGQRFLWRVRFGLHLRVGRCEDRLLFDHQRALAERFGYSDQEGKLAVEQFMHDYYRTVLALREVNDVLLQLYDEEILSKGVAERIRPINERFRVHNDYIEALSPRVFEDCPAAMLELFVLMANDEHVQGVRAGTIRLIRDNLHLIDDAFRNDPKITHYFMDLLRASYNLVSQLTRMRRYGVLGAYLPEYGRVVGQMQHDLFHIYTVDAHTMQVIRNMRRFRYESAREKFPVASECVHRLSKIELLYVAGLYHDIGKGRGGDHSNLGALQAREFCRRHRLSSDDSELVAWLVRDHLVMSSIAQRNDISDPKVIQDFRLRVKTPERLDYLYALTVADINATNPTLWNSWRATLLRQLYTETRNALQRGLGTPMERAQRVRESMNAALEALGAVGIDREQALMIWDNPDEAFFFQQNTDDIVWQTVAIAEHSPDEGPLVLVRNVTGPVETEGATQIFLYTPDQANLFAVSVGALDQLNLSIQGARIHTSQSGLCFNTYLVLDEDGLPLGEHAARFAAIRDTLRMTISDPASFPRVLRRRVPRTLRQFALPTEVLVSDDPSGDYTVLRVLAADRPGLLARLGGIFMEFDLNVLSANITTLGERVEDVFFITDRHGELLTDSDTVATIKRTICERLDSAVDQ